MTEAIVALGLVALVEAGAIVALVMRVLRMSQEVVIRSADQLDELVRLNASRSYRDFVATKFAEAGKPPQPSHKTREQLEREEYDAAAADPHSFGG